jgi:hypothetical protein
MSPAHSLHLKVPSDFLLLSECVDRLGAGMWAGVSRPAPVDEMKRLFPGWSSIGFGPWREKAAQYLKAAVLKRQLSLFIATGPKVVPALVPVRLLERLITARGVLTGRPVRLFASIRAADVEEKFFALLNAGVLVLNTAEFDVWYKLARAKGRWPSQRKRRKKGRGAPTKQSVGLRSRIEWAVHTGKWRADKPPEGGTSGIAALRRLLLAQSFGAIPSADTLGRFVDQMYTENGDPALRRKQRNRRAAIADSAKFPGG